MQNPAITTNLVNEIHDRGARRCYANAGDGPPERVMTSPATLQPRLPRVMCPECGRIMKLIRAEPHPESEQRRETLTFACTCGFTLTQNVGRYD
jgi:hypothetical protein